MKTRILLVLIILLFTYCKNPNTESSSGLLESMGLLQLRGSRVQLSGTVIKGIVKNAKTMVTPLATDGSCMEKSPIMTGTTDELGSYSLVYNRTGSVVCLLITPNPDGQTKMYDEKSQKDLLIASTSKFKMVMIFPESKIEGNSRRNIMISPFSRIIAKRIQFLVKTGGISEINRFHKRASKELVIRFGLNRGISNASRATGTSKSISDENVPELEDLLLQLDDPGSSLTAKFVSVLVGISHLANKYKNGGEVAADDLDEIIEAFSADFADGAFDGKGPDGQSITIGSGANQITFSGDPLATVLLPAIVSYFQEGGTLSVGIPTNTPPPVLSVAEITSQVSFAGNTPIVSNDYPSINLSYPNSPYTFLVNQSITAITPVVSGSQITSCTVTPALPLGLVLGSNCAITGIPSTPQSSKTYTVTATNGSTTGSASLSILINDEPPSALSYVGSPFTFIANTPVATLAPSVTGSIQTCNSVPALPSGLSLNQSSCQIQGTPTVSSGNSSYTITAINSYGQTQTSINIQVNPQVGLTYPSANYTFTNGTGISALSPTVTNGTATGFSITPSLPAGLNWNPSTGVISGTPSATSPTVNYTILVVSANNGSNSYSVNITINQMPAPAGLNYSGNPYQFVEGLSIAPLTPTFSGTVSTCTASALPAGLFINASNCVITGTPTVLQGSIGYTITASNAGGSISFTLNIAIVDLPPECYSYNSISGDDRHTGLTGTRLCDDVTMNNSWVRFTGTYTKMATSAPPVNYCNTDATGYLNFAHPATKGQQVSGTACFNWSGNTCNFNYTVQVSNCNGFFVYKLPSTSCSLRYCTVLP